MNEKRKDYGEEEERRKIEEERRGREEGE